MRSCVYICLMLVFASCSSQKGIFAPKSPHKQYEEKLKDAGLHQSAIGRLWISAAEKSLASPRTMKIPFAETGYFEADRPDAAGYLFSARRGEKILVSASRKPLTGFVVFLELWQIQADGPRLIASADTLLTTLAYEVRQDGDYMIRLQPELLGAGQYSLQVTSAASLAFPVHHTGTRIGSFWGDDRDGGARSHEGVDIFGSFRTPVLAAADGFVSSVTENRLGGKVIFMRPAGRDYHLYYAHLDSQLVVSGQRVHAGDIMGLMGNTGNARNTPTHLHFGIYTGGGAIDPLPFIQQQRPGAPAITAPLGKLNDYVRAGRNTSLYDQPRPGPLQTVPVNTLMRILAATGQYYRVKLPDDREKFVPYTQVDAAEEPIRSITLLQDTPMFDRPDHTAAGKRMLARGEKIRVNAVFGNYYYIIHDKTDGWVPAAAGK